MGRRLLLSLPAVAAAIVTVFVLAERGAHVRYAQVLGGPTGTVSSLLVRSLELTPDGRTLPSPGLGLRLTLEGSDLRATRDARTDETGQLELRFDGEPTVADPWLRVETGSPAQLLAEGRLSLSPERWRAAARESGGWLPGQAQGALRVRAAAESGTFAVPFPGALVVQVLEQPASGGAGADTAASVAGERPVAGAELAIELTGAALLEPVPLTRDTGLSRVSLQPEEHAVSARIVARAGARHGEWYGVLPVTPGAIVAERSGDVLGVRSPIVRERAFASIVSANARIAGAIVALAADADGGASGSIRLDAPLVRRIEREPTWAVVSSEFDKRSPGVVGWPLNPGAFDAAAPRRTFDVADAVLLDGRAGAIHAAERARASRRRLGAVALLAVGLAMLASFWMLVRRRQGPGVTPGATSALRSGGEAGPLDPQREQDLSEVPPLAPGGWVLVLALGCIVLGLAGLAYFGLMH